MKTAGWVVDHGTVHVSTADGATRVSGDTRAYLVEDYRRTAWREHKYVRIDPTEPAEPFAFDLDVSGVPCGCLACVYLVAMRDPSSFKGSNYCDMGGFGASECPEVDLVEANREAMQTAIHMESGGGFGTGKCNRIGCFLRTGGDATNAQVRKEAYGIGKKIDSAHPFRLTSRLDPIGGLTVSLSQEVRQLH